MRTMKLSARVGKRQLISEREALYNLKQLRQSADGRYAIDWFESKYDSDSMMVFVQWQIIEAFYLGLTDEQERIRDMKKIDELLNDLTKSIELQAIHQDAKYSELARQQSIDEGEEDPLTYEDI